jgi:hypothetical protein
MKRILTGSAMALFLLAAQSTMTGCMTTAKESRKQERVSKKSKKETPGSYGLVSSRNKVDQRHLRRGQKAMFSNALDSY